MTDVRIVSVRVVELRFPTSRDSIGSDAVNKDPDYSAAYCILSTDSGTEGHGLTFTLGRGTELCVMAIKYLARFVEGRTLSSITEDFVAFTRQLTNESQFRWLGPEKGVIHLACGALINAVWAPVCQGGRQAALATARRPLAREDRVDGRLLLYRRRHHKRRSTPHFKREPADDVSTSSYS